MARTQKLCPRCGTPMMEFNAKYQDGAKTSDWHCPTHGMQMTISTQLDTQPSK